ncbi:SCO family protein [Burkholderia pseudomallei]|uniref:SCO family protein n=1 Tax=Burkholderia pseudomallei TaxID=28450 RepID=UPI0003D91450|nr:SCO family protein [Burkholderia pseudomallei]AHE31538.1 SCO1/SenC family protein [Burkholderia pseudomallei NCTC 13178]KGC46153.1 SCO1/SenC family protein [Burkholderia pseudomallei]KGD55950.1 SCO1/SenC family protein [Burkholderia pseudomallei]KGX72803.1 SCO1/SenC family protein [Burkholderia pseudomallei TSV28]
MNIICKLSIFVNALIAAAAFTFTGRPASAQENMHAHHDMMMSSMKTSTAAYTVPVVTLIRDDGKAVALKDELDDGRPVVLTFIYTTCTSICPVISQTLSQFQHGLGTDREKIHIVSISIDPENDTPARLREYAARFGAGPEWQHYTGTAAASVVVQKAFNVYRQDKMDHNPVLLLRAMPGKSWLRIDGFATPDDLLHFYHSLIASN